MQVSVWNDWLKLFDARLRLQNRHIILLYDGASTHILQENTVLSNIRLHKLPPNTTAHLQPCDAGIIKSFKVSTINNFKIHKKLHTIPIFINKYRRNTESYFCKIVLKLLIIVKKPVNLCQKLQ